MKRPIREYLQELPSPYNTLALSVVDEKYKLYKAKVDSLSDAIRCMCDWDNTPQGFHFWNDVHRWRIYPNEFQLPSTPAVEVSPEVEQPKTEMESCLDKKLSDNPTIADSIGSHMQLAFKYSQQLVNENTRLRAQLYRLPILEQENTELRADKERIVDLLNKAQITIAELENQLANLTSKPIQSKEPVYDAEWLQNILQSNFGSQYNYSGNGIVAIIPNGFDEHFYLDPKASAGIILEALAKELNPLFEASKDGYIFDVFYDTSISADGDKYQVGKYSKAHITNCSIFTSKQAAQKAIGILTQIAPQVLKNYFA
jgi:hypothetical protein